MANITPYTDAIANAVYGEEVRGSIINALNKVNDDNNSYQQLKTDIIAAKDDVEEAVAEYQASITEGETKKGELEAATTAANTAKSQLTSATSTANTAKTNLEAATTAANTAKTNADNAASAANSATTAAGTAKTNLEGTISDAEDAQSDLEGAINTGRSGLTTLNTAISNATLAKTNLDGSITNAGTAKTQLDGTITDADTARSQLSGTITEAGTAKTALDGSVTTANGVLQGLTNENASAASNLEELRSENFNSQEILAGVANIEAYLGITTDVLGLSVDYENKTCTRLAGAVGKTAGADFNSYLIYGGRRRCNVADDGTIAAFYGDQDFAEDGSMGQVMVYQPKFYYLVAPVNYDVQETGIGYHLRKANYYVSEKPRTGFRLHPAFYDADGNEVDYYLIGAYEGCLYDESASEYITDDSQVMNAAEDKFSSIAGVKPASGVTQNLTRPNVEAMAQNRGTNFHSFNIKIASAEQLLMMIELGTMNTQSAIGNGVVSISDSPSTTNNSSYTGSTSSLGNTTGMAAETINERNGTEYTETANGKVAITYRGVENLWGNIWAFAYGVNIWGNGSMHGGEPYICEDFNYAESKRTDNYEGAGFTISNATGYISAMGYSTRCDWLFMASECSGNATVPVGDYTYVTPNLNGYRIACLGGSWNGTANAGAFSWSCHHSVGARTRSIGGRLVYVPKSTDASYTTSIAAWEAEMQNAA